ncbi:MAG: sigma-70 family RNA polymerase sigma factor [Anaerolineae bacterium]
MAQPSEEVTDEVLVSRVAGGEREALAEIYDRYARVAFSLAVSILGDRMSAEEVTQDAFLRVWHAASGYQPSRGAFATWLMAIVRHRAIDELRRGRLPLEMEPPIPLENPASFAELAPGVDESVLRGLRMRAALARLPEEQRSVILLSYFMGLTHREIAERQDTPLGTIKTRMRLGLQKLRQIYRDDD